MTSAFRLLLAAFAVLAFALVSFPGGVRAAVFNPETFTLSNGMQVVVVTNRRMPVVTHMVWYKVGAADEPQGHSGIAHFLEHLMFKGTESLPNGAFSRIVARNGGQENAFTSSDYTAYFQNVARDRLELVMGMEADRMTNLSLTREVIEPERQVILEERRQRVDNDPYAQLSEHMSAALYLNHPYRTPVIGWAAEVERLSLEDIVGFYKSWYAPNNAILVVSGDITAAELRPMAEKTYGVIPPGPKMERARPPEPPHNGSRRVSVSDQKVRQPAWNRMYLAPSYTAGEVEHAYALQVLEQILGGATGRLYRSLVVEGKQAVSAGAGYSPERLDLTSFGFYASPRPGVEMETIEKAVESEIASLLADGVTGNEVARAKTSLIAGAVYARDNYRTGARVLGSALASGQTVSDVEAWPTRIGAVTVEQVNAAARAVFNEKYSVTGLLLPAGKKS
ncbi:MAG: insulinase family protein [Rhodospirillales bacterium]|nr:insulinase family protein [Rhodospirillales bacterium]MCW8861802.1 insulinase family protein [Rhodospirillales bacterium]MCW8951465.1 insulinase family protein [Rhodospirillales bacterium]MCW8970877.1 insulinase family protein [Rhodospirillales bacterium]MCW9001685.1 insulinase family protein [Rhodospirillales bacterium]